MEWLKNIFMTKPAWKIFLSLALGIIGLIIVVWLVGFAFRSAFGGQFFNRTSYDMVSPSSSSYSESYAPQGIGGGAKTTLSARNMLLPDPRYPSGTSGGDAEAFEATDYSVGYETGNLESLCVEIEELKSRAYVVFESANRGDRSCQYTFKVEKKRVSEIKDVIESLDPKTLVENTYTIKTVLEDFTSREDILKKKLTAIEDTLTQAQRAYDELRILATSARDAESLAKVIESKINLIERLTNERLNLREELDRLAQEKTLQLDRLDYTYFHISAVEKLIFDSEYFKDVWVAELQQFVRELNGVVQGITLDLLSFGLRVFQVVLYAVIILFVAKYGWRMTKRFWQSGSSL